VRALAWFALIVLPVLSVAAEGAVKVDGSARPARR
jgi:hypothetical protein